MFSEVRPLSIELYMLLNLAPDLALLGAASRALGLFNARRVLAAGALCAAYAAVAAAHPLPWASLPAQLALLAGISVLMTRRTSLRMARCFALSLGCAALVSGGAARLMPGHAGPLRAFEGIAAGILALSLLFSARPPHSCDYRVRIRLEGEGGYARFPALVDTGNRIREPISGLPVLIAEASLLRGILPREGFRELHYGAVGGEGCMRCFRPEGVWIERGGRATRGPEVWVAVAPGRLPGAFQALAPPEFTLYIQ